jgi:cation transport protein ChaC
VKIPPKKVVPPLTQLQRKESIRQTLEKRPQDRPVLVFGYGSLLWKPIISFRGYEKAKLNGWSRKVCSWTVHARGTIKKPGLVFGLDKDKTGYCEGLAFEVDAEFLKQDLETLWEQEMYSNLYKPQWLPVITQRGPCLAIAFTINQNHPLYAGDIPDDKAVDIISAANGVFGACADYFTKTTQSLRNLGLNDSRLEEIVRLIQQRTTKK